MILLTHERTTINAMNEAALGYNVCDAGGPEAIKTNRHAIYCCDVKSPFPQLRALTRYLWRA